MPERAAVRVLGLDPGSRFTGFGLVEIEGSRLRALAADRIVLSPALGLPERLARLSLELDALLDRFAPDLVAIEKPFLGVSTSSLIVLAQARGVLLAGVARRGVPVREYAPAEVKSALGSGRADKGQVARLVGLLLALDVSALPADATDALAVALCCAHRRRAETLVAVAPKGIAEGHRNALTRRSRRASVIARRP